MFNPRRARMGRLLATIGVVALVAALAATVVAWRLVEDGTAALRSSLDVTFEAVDTLDESVELSLETLTVAGSGLAALEGTLIEAGPTLDRIAGIVDGVSTMAAEEVPEGLDEIAEVLGTVSVAADALNQTLAALEVLGLDVGSGPAIGDSLDVVDEQLADISTILRTEGANLGAVAGDFRSLGDDAAVLAEALTQVVDNVDRAGDLLASYNATTAEASQLVETTRTDLDRRRNEARLLVVLLGVVLASAALTPLLLGRQMMLEAGGAPPIRR